jgi:hypothetical protein
MVDTVYYVPIFLPGSSTNNLILVPKCDNDPVALNHSQGGVVIAEGLANSRTFEYINYSLPLMKRNLTPTNKVNNPSKPIEGSGSI